MGISIVYPSPLRQPCLAIVHPLVRETTANLSWAYHGCFISGRPITNRRSSVSIGTNYVCAGVQKEIRDVESPIYKASFFLYCYVMHNMLILSFIMFSEGRSCRIQPNSASAHSFKELLANIQFSANIHNNFLQETSLLRFKRNVWAMFSSTLLYSDV